MQILKWIPVDTLSILIESPDVVDVVGEPQFWKSRVEIAFDKDLSNELDVDWPAFSYKLEKEGIHSLLKSSRLDEVRLALEHGADPSVQHSESLIYAAVAGREDIVKLLLQDPRTDPNAKNDAAIRNAIKLGRVEVVKALLQDGRARPSADNHSALKYILPIYQRKLSPEHTTIVRDLIRSRKIDVIYNDNLLVKWVSYWGYVNLLKYLLYNRQVDPGAEDSQALMVAVQRGHAKVVEALLSSGRVNPQARNGAILDAARKAGNEEILRLLGQ